MAFALAAYRADHGHYPEKLGELAPKYLAAVPDDLFSGKALIYRTEGKGYLLYSVGANGRDDGGRWIDDDPPGDDLRVRMPLPEPKAKKSAGRPRRLSARSRHPGVACNPASSFSRAAGSTGLTRW